MVLRNNNSGSVSVLKERGFMDRRYLGIKDCSEYLGVTKGTLYVWVCYRKIPYIKVGRLVKFDIRLIEEWLKANTVPQLN